MWFRSAILAVLLAVAPASAFAGPLWIGPTAGVGVPFGDFSDVASTGFNLGLIGDYELNRNFAVGGEVGWQTYGGNDDFEKDLSAVLGTSVDVKTTAVPALVHGKLRITSNEGSAPYAKLALGLYRTTGKVEGSGISNEDSSTDFAFGVGGGWNRARERVRYGIDAMIHFISTEGQSSNVLLVRGQLMFGGGS